MSAPTMSANPVTRADVPSVWRQMAALVRVELLLLKRNMMATMMSVVTPLGLGVLLVSGDYDTEGGVTRVAGVLGMIAVFCIHHHLATAYAARRQEMVLKRMRAGIPGDGTILVGVASATIIVFLVQAVLLIAYGMLVHDLPLPANPLTMLLAMLLGAAVLAAFGAVISAVTRSSEAAMLTTMPTMIIFLMAPGVLLPLGSLPPVLENIAMALPMGPFTEVLRVGWLGHELGGGAPMSFAETTVAALPWLLELAAWLAVSAWLTKRYFKWEPRHG